MRCLPFLGPGSRLKHEVSNAVEHADMFRMIGLQRPRLSRASRSSQGAVQPRSGETGLSGQQHNVHVVQDVQPGKPR